VKEETSWLIEMPMATFGGPPCWWTGEYRSGKLNHQWSTDPLDAVRFARKEDAERVLHGTLRLKEAIATEHQWIGAKETEG
jgi:hypothetical protein